MKEKGITLAITIAILMFLTVTILVFSYYLDTQTKWAEKRKRQNIAYNAAYAGVQQAINKLNNTYLGWEKAADNIIPSGYDGTTTYRHYGTNNKLIGYYKVKIIPESKTRITIAGVGTDLSRAELSGVRVIYGGELLETTIKAQSEIELESASLEIHWGMVMAVDDDIEANPDRLFPRKWAGDGYEVEERDPNGADEPPDEGPSYDAMGNPITDLELYEWRSDVEEIQPTTFDLGTYKEKAKKYRVPNPDLIFRAPNDAAIADPPGSGYFPLEVTDPKTGETIEQDEITFGKSASQPYIDRCSTATYFIEGNCKFQNNAVLIAPEDGLEDNEIAIIVLDKVEMKEGRDIGTSYVLELPESAWKEYVAIDTDATGEYPGDLGYRSNASTYDLADGGYNTNVILNGFLYVGGDFKISGNSVMIGCLYVKGEATVAKGTPVLFYNKKVTENIIYEQAAWTPITSEPAWAEFNPKSFDNPVWPQ